METKKNKRADLDSCHFLFLEIGLTCAMGFVLLAFHWKTHDKPYYELASAHWVPFEEETVPITRPEQPPPPTPPQNLQQLVIVEDQATVTEEVVFDVEATQKTEIRVYEPVAIIAAEEPEVDETEVFVIVEEMPSFPGGESARLSYLSKNLRYPKLAVETGIEGSVFITFVVMPNGSVSDVRVLRGIGGGCDEEAIRVVQGMPRWNPGKQRGIPVKVQFNMPVRFVLNS
jgi:periplasmic protein TonB